MTFVLEASLGLIHEFCAHAAIEQVEDERAQHWLAERLPGAMEREGRIIYVPSPFELAFDDAFKPNPAWRDHPVLVAAKARRRALERTAAVGYARDEHVIGFEAFQAPRYSGVVVDWLLALPEIEPRMLDKLGRLTWQQAVDHAVRWHDRLADRRREGVAGDLGTVDRIDVTGMPGWYWVHLVTKRALDNEGAVMGHCVGSGYDYMTWLDGVRPEGRHAECGIWSLRDPDGRSRVTVEIGYDGIQQAQGPGNDRPGAEVVPAFASLIPRFLVDDEFFDTPYWLVREKDGSTRLRTDGEARADMRSIPRYAVGHGQVLFRMGTDTWRNLGDVEGFQIEAPVTRRERFARQGRTPLAEAVTNHLDAEIRMTPIGVSQLVDAMARMREDATVDAILGTARPAAQMEEIHYAAPACEAGPSRRERHEARQPWYRRQERQQTWRTPR